MWITESGSDPVGISLAYSRDKIELRIGKEKPGETRYALLTPVEARKVAYALLSVAEDAKSN